MIRLSDDNISLSTPIYQSSKFSLPSIKEIKRLFSGKREGFLYSRFSNPTVRELEIELANRQGCEDAICCSSGVAAISSVLFSALQSGDRMIMFVESYKPSRYLANHFLKKFGVTVLMESLRDPEIDKKIVQNKPRLVLFESPTNPSLFLADFEKIVSASKSVGAMTVLDNTFAGLSEHRQLGIDVYIHSLSKQANGHGDVIAGAVLSSQGWIDRHRNHFVQLGSCMDPNSAFLVLRGLKTYELREKRQAETAEAVAKFLESEDKYFRNIRYPKLPSHPQFKLAQKNMKSGGYVISADYNGSEKEFEKFIAKLKCFYLTGSLGSTESLIAPSYLFYAGELTDTEIKTSEITLTTFRLSIGLEEPQILIADLLHAAEVSLLA